MLVPLSHPARLAQYDFGEALVVITMELARCECIQLCDNVIAVGNSGTGKTHVALGLGLAARHRGLSVGFTTAAGLVHELREASPGRKY